MSASLCALTWTCVWEHGCCPGGLQLPQRYSQLQWPLSLPLSSALPWPQLCVPSTSHSQRYCPAVLRWASSLVCRNHLAQVCEKNTVLTWLPPRVSNHCSFSTLHGESGEWPGFRGRGRAEGATLEVCPGSKESQVSSLVLIAFHSGFLKPSCL